MQKVIPPKKFIHVMIIECGCGMIKFLTNQSNGILSPKLGLNAWDIRKGESYQMVSGEKTSGMINEYLELDIQRIGICEHGICLITDNKQSENVQAIVNQGSRLLIDYLSAGPSAGYKPIITKIDDTDCHNHCGICQCHTATLKLGREMYNQW